MEHQDKSKRNQAIALHYGEDDNAPRILASGPGEIAKRILEVAEQNNIPIKRDDNLVSILSNFEVGVTVPPECYRAVAEILAFLFRTDVAWREKKLAQFSDFGQKK